MLVKREPTTPTDGYAVIELSQDKVCLVDEEDYEYLNSFWWVAFKWSARYYAARKIIHKGRVFWLPMHRQITHCPKGLIVHHENYDTLDNRKKNLTNMSKEQHSWIHGFR